MNQSKRLSTLNYLMEMLWNVSRLLDALGYVDEATKLREVKHDLEAKLPKVMTG